MTDLARHNPIVTALYFGAVALLPLLTMHPLLLCGAVCGGLSLFLLQRCKGAGFYLLILLSVALVNPLLSHKGQTVLLVVNDAPITLEAVLFGIAAGCGVLATLLYFAVFSKIMTSDRILYLLGRISPRIALLFSMALRFTPLFSSRYHETKRTQRATGLYHDDDLLSVLKSELAVFSAVTTRALENGVITANGMEARGYGVKKRTTFSLFPFHKRDAALLFFVLFFFALTLFLFFLGAFECAYYPTLHFARSPLTLLGGASYGCLCFLPCFIHLKESVKWNCLKSKI